MSRIQKINDMLTILLIVYIGSFINVYYPRLVMIRLSYEQKTNLFEFYKSDPNVVEKLRVNFKNLDSIKIVTLLFGNPFIYWIVVLFSTAITLKVLGMNTTGDDLIDSIFNSDIGKIISIIVVIVVEIPAIIRCHEHNNYVNSFLSSKR
jgi:hypothetical protein